MAKKNKGTRWGKSFTERAREAEAKKFPPRGKEPCVPLEPPKGRRVHVKSGDGKTDLGEGAYVGDVKVFFIQMPNGTLRSEANAERPPLRASVPTGAKVVESGKNPKIVLDSGKIVYGCQVWWEYVIPETVKKRVAEGFGVLLKSISDVPDIVVRRAMERLLAHTQLMRGVGEAVLLLEESLGKAAEKERKPDAV